MYANLVSLGRTLENEQHIGMRMGHGTLHIIQASLGTFYFCVGTSDIHSWNRGITGMPSCSHYLTISHFHLYTRSLILLYPNDVRYSLHASMLFTSMIVYFIMKVPNSIYTYLFDIILLIKYFGEMSEKCDWSCFRLQLTVPSVIYTVCTMYIMRHINTIISIH